MPRASVARARYHAAAVVASNFPVVLAAAAERLFAGAGVEGDAARDATLQLMQSALANLKGAPPSTALTGPVARGDAATVGRHLDALDDEPLVREAYAALSRLALELAGPTLAPSALAALAELLSPSSIRAAVVAAPPVSAGPGV
jgi:predicted short-subunit dehydrogenase-like oxidoreductase (DUF2520 family)